VSARISEAEADRIGLGKKGKKAPAGKRKNKYNAVRTEADGYKFDSKAEAKQYLDLKARQAAGEIRNLVVEKKRLTYQFVINGIKIGAYEADFRYFDVALGRVIVADKKSFPTRQNPVYKLKKKLMLAVHGIEITEL
jgi:hypothetical protein